MAAHYGKFSGAENYIALIGRKGADLDEKAGYYGEKIVLAETNVLMKQIEKYIPRWYIPDIIWVNNTIDYILLGQMILCTEE